MDEKPEPACNMEMKSFCQSGMDIDVFYLKDASTIPLNTPALTQTSKHITELCVDNDSLPHCPSTEAHPSAILIC